MMRQVEKETAHFTGSGRDLDQLRAVCSFLKDEQSFLFVGCSYGDEIVDLQRLLKGSGYLFFGVDSNEEVAEIAPINNFIFPIKIIIADILQENAIGKIRTQSEHTYFDVVICRNLLIYYDEDAVKKISGILAELCCRLLVFGVSDPFFFAINNNKTEIAEHTLEVLDFDNRIFEKNEMHPMP